MGFLFRIYTRISYYYDWIISNWSKCGNVTITTTLRTTTTSGVSRILNSALNVFVLALLFFVF